MKEKKLYTCEICHTDYANPEDAEACEGSHKPTWGEGFKVEGVYQPKKRCPDGIPGMLWVTFSDGSRILYRESHE